MPSNPLTRPCFLEIYGVLHRVEVFAIGYIAYAGEREAAQLLPVTRDDPAPWAWLSSTAQRDSADRYSSI
jgi:hypothetical protein